jgi:CRP-like cAMP-binding protein
VKRLLGRDLSGERWGSLFRDFPVHRYPPGSEVQRQGEVPIHVLVLRTGVLKLVHGWPDGRSTIVALRSAPYLLALEAVLLRQDLPVTAVALTPCELLLIPCEHCRELARRDGDFARSTQLELCREHHRQLVQIAGLARLTARERLDGFLRDLSQEYGDTSGRLELPLHDWELAQLIAVTPPYLSHLMHELVGQGRLERRGSHWVYLGRPRGAESVTSSTS